MSNNFIAKRSLLDVFETSYFIWKAQTTCGHSIFQMNFDNSVASIQKRGEFYAKVRTNLVSHIPINKNCFVVPTKLRSTEKRRLFAKRCGVGNRLSWGINLCSCARSGKAFLWGLKFLLLDKIIHHVLVALRFSYDEILIGFPWCSWQATNSWSHSICLDNTPISGQFGFTFLMWPSRCSIFCKFFELCVFKNIIRLIFMHFLRENIKSK